MREGIFPSRNLKFLSIALAGFIFLLAISFSVYGQTVVYNFTFDGASTQNWSKIPASQGDITASSNRMAQTGDYRFYGYSGVNDYWSAGNFSMTGLIHFIDAQYIEIGFFATDSVPSGADPDIQVIFQNTNDDVEIRNNVAQLAICDHTISNNANFTYLINVTDYQNMTVQVDGVDVCNADISSDYDPTDDQRGFVFIRQATVADDYDYIDNFAILDVNVAGGPPPGDTDPPVFSNYLQDPSNATLFNSATGVTMNVTVTDASTVTEVNLTHSNNGNIFVNGTMFDIGVLHYPLSNDSDVYRFELDETDYLPATYNLDHDIMEQENHIAYNLKGLNRFLSFEFLNVTNATDVNFYEVMDENATANAEFAQYYYCNSDYDFSSSVTGSVDCTLFASVLNTLGFNHSHGKSKHRIISLGIDSSTGQVGDVEVTPVSYIVKRGTQFGDNVYYIVNESRANAFRLSTNGGVAWSSLSIGTFDTHLHQIPSGTALNYSYSSCDSEGNCAVSAEQYDLIEFGDLPPNSVDIHVPIQDGLYNGTIYINHSTSFAPSGATLLNYTYEYKTDASSQYIYIDFNDIATTTYTWDITALNDGIHQFKVTVYDSNGLTSISVHNFEVDNPPTLIDVTEEGFANLNTTFSEGVKTMILFSGIFLFAILLVIGFMSRFYVLWSIAGSMMVLFYMYFAERFITTGSGFDKGFMLFMVFVGFLFMVLGVVLQLWKLAESRKANKPPGFYDIDY